jgi:hypothetical protein
VSSVGGPEGLALGAPTRLEDEAEDTGDNPGEDSCACTDATTPTLQTVIATMGIDRRNLNARILFWYHCKL